VTSTQVTMTTSPQLKPVLKNTSENNANNNNNVSSNSGNNVKKVELRVNANPNRPRPRSVAVPNPATGSGLFSDGLDDVRLVSLPSRQQVEMESVTNVTGGAKTDSNGNMKPSVTFHTVLDRPVPGAGVQEKNKEGQPVQGGKYKKSGGGQSWRSIFHLGQPLSRSRPGTGTGHELRGSHREINIDDAILPENKPLNYRPRPRSEINLSYSIQDSTLMLTPLKNNEFQVTTTNQFSYLPYQQNLLNCNKQHQQPFTRTNKLRQNFNKRGYKAHASARPKSVDFEVLQSLENICRCQPIAYATGNGLLPLGARGHVGPHPCDPGHIMPRELLERSHMASHVALRASQREKLKHDHMVGEWTNLHATRV